MILHRSVHTPDGLQKAEGEKRVNGGGHTGAEVPTGEGSRSERGGRAQPNVPGKALQQRGTALQYLIRATALSGSGLVAAAVIGSAALLAGAQWALLLVVFFVAAMSVSRLRRETKIRRAGNLLEKTGARDAVQVLANGGAFAVGAVIFALSADPAWVAFALGSLAAASADTWATELGLLSPTVPHSIITGKHVPPGASGGVTLAGTGAGVVGAFVVTATGLSVAFGPAAAFAGIGGIAGMLADSVLGAIAQERRWCERCRRVTERRIHTCGTATLHHAGVRGLGNDAVNALAAIAGGLVTVLLARAAA